jgi:protein-disulfide isomerase
MGAVQNDIAEIKQNQEAIRKDLIEIKTMFQARQAQQLPKAQSIDEILNVENAPTKGAKNAKLTLIEFSDYQCPFCKRHAESTFHQIDKTYISTGKIRYVFRDFPMETIHKQAQKAAEAALCAGDQGKYWEMHDKLFAKQEALDLVHLSGYAKSVGVEIPSFKKCLVSGKYNDMVRQNSAEGLKIGINGTPSFLLGISDGNKVKSSKLIIGAQPFFAFKQEIDALLNE